MTFGIDPIRHAMAACGESESTQAIARRGGWLVRVVGRRGRSERTRHRAGIERIDPEQPSVAGLGAERHPADHEDRRCRNDRQVAPGGRLIDGLIEGRGQTAVGPHESSGFQPVDLLIARGKLESRLHPAETRVQRAAVGGAGLDGPEVDAKDLDLRRFDGRGTLGRAGEIAKPSRDLLRDRRLGGERARDRETDEDRMMTKRPRHEVVIGRTRVRTQAGGVSSGVHASNRVVPASKRWVVPVSSSTSSAVLGS